MTLPNFLIVGAHKGGTTALYHYLTQHPQIFMSKMKEPGFFDFEGKTPDFRGPGDQELYSSVVNNIDDYLKLFEDVSQETAIGEATVYYLYSLMAPQRIQHHIPHVKLIAILRNPVDRAYSAYMHAVRDGRETLSFAKALEQEESRISDNWEYIWHYQNMGFYSNQLKQYFQYFEREKFRIHLYDDLNDNPTYVLKDIFQFLNVDDSFMPKFFTRINISGVRKSKTIDALLNDNNSIKQFLKPFLPAGFRKSIANHLRTQNFSKPPYPSEVKKKLINVFREDVLELQDMLDRDLSHWLKE